MKHSLAKDLVKILKPGDVPHGYLKDSISQYGFMRPRAGFVALHLDERAD